MWNNIQVSLYDLFGYFYPGAIFLVALTLVIWLLPPAQISGQAFQLSAAFWIILIFACYLAGHIVQAVANLVFPKERQILRSLDEITPALMAKTRLEIETAFGLESREIDDIWLFRLCDATFHQSGRVENRMIFESREGFYRGLVISVAILFVALVVKIAVSGRTLRMPGASFKLAWPLIIALQLFCLAACRLFYQRYLRFSRYMVRETILGYLASRKATPKTEEDELEE